MLKAIITEFIGICEHLRKSKCLEKKRYLIISKENLVVLLDKNKYETSRNKLMVWKQLHWIDTDSDKLTRKVYDADHKNGIRCIKIDIGVFEELKRLNER